MSFVAITYVRVSVLVSFTNDDIILEPETDLLCNIHCTRPEQITQDRNKPAYATGRLVYASFQDKGL